MKSFYREPMIEEGVHNIILQNRCGNRLTLLCLEDKCEMEFVYKPNAFRRKDFRSRNFSNRDNQTVLFSSFFLSDITSTMIKNVDYDPFYTKLEIQAESGAINTISIVNVADENCFVISARQPLLLAIKPHDKFNICDGTLYELFSERGEDIISFISFPSFELNRYRILDDGTHVLQILENDLVLVGGEENKTQMTRILKRFEGMTLDDLISQNEKIIKATLNKGLVYVNENDFQQVIDLNRRIIFSGMDEGGACFGALNRIYYLIWVRDGSMTSCHMALAGNPVFIQRWTPFLLFNPSQTRDNNKKIIREFSQLVGTRWSKSEDDGLFYAVWTAFTYFRTTGDISLFSDELISLLIECIENHVERCWDERLSLLSSDTLGEDPLRASPYFGYDIVNGSILKIKSKEYKHNNILRCNSLYHQVNMYNVFLMTVCLLNEYDKIDLVEYQKKYLNLASALRNSLKKNFIDENGKLYSLRFDMEDGTEKFLGIVKGIDYWEHGWAVSQGPFFPLPSHQFESCCELYKSWESIAGSYGFCPWNVMARQLFNYGMNSNEHRIMLQREVSEALTKSKKYPLFGALTEYAGAPEGWRALPFSAGSFLLAHTSLILYPLAMGLAIRASDRVSRIENFMYRLYRIYAYNQEHGKFVLSYTINKKQFRYCLQIPEKELKPGKNIIKIIHCEKIDFTQLYESDAELLSLEENENGISAIFSSPIPKNFCFLNAKNAKNISFTKDEKTLFPEIIHLSGTPFTFFRIEEPGEITLNFAMK